MVYISFTEKQKDYLHNADARWNIKTGAVRSGKTYLDLFLIPKRIRAVAGKDGLCLLLGVTRATVERNILEPMRQIWGEELVGIVSPDGSIRLFGEECYVLGASMAGTVSKLRGMSIKYAYGDEIADWNSDVFRMLASRMDKPYSRFDGTANPQGPEHWLKKFIESTKTDIFHQNYTIFDNPHLSPSFVENLCQEYAGSVYYDRYILGSWAAGDGIVYPMFSPERHVVPADDSPKPGCRYFAAVDYGTVNPFAIGVFEMDGVRSTMIREVHYDGRADGRVDNEEYYVMLKNACAGLPIEKVIVDPSAAGFIQTIVKYREFVVEGAVNDVLNGIMEVTKYLNLDIMLISESCPETIREFALYSWDNEGDTVVKRHDHHMDLLRYYVYGVCRSANIWLI